MSSSEKFCLRWNDFESNISVAFRELREDKDFFDVTLACDDDQIQAHKLILSACSSFFRTILRRNKHEHPLLYLKGVKYADLISVLNFMYHGEVNVAQEELNSFLSVAEDLKVKGLTQSSSDSNSTPQTEPSKTQRQDDQAEKQQPARPMKQSRLLSYPPPSLPPLSKNNAYHSNEEDVTEVIPIKSEPVSAPVPTIPPTQSYPGGVVADPGMEYAEEDEYVQYDAVYEESDIAGYGNGMQGTVIHHDGSKDDPEALISSYFSKTTSKETGLTVWQCHQCEKSSKWKTQIKNHVEAVHLSKVLLYSCSFCAHVTHTSAGLKMHTRRNHSHM